MDVFNVFLNIQTRKNETKSLSDPSFYSHCSASKKAQLLWRWCMQRWQGETRNHSSGSCSCWNHPTLLTTESMRQILITLRAYGMCIIIVAHSTFNLIYILMRLCIVETTSVNVYFFIKLMLNYNQRVLQSHTDCVI